MGAGNFIFTSESVGEGHPDKVADQISDAILDAHLRDDPHSRVACETLVKGSAVVLAGEITSRCDVPYQHLVRQVIRDIGYTDPKVGFDADTAEIHTFITKQSPDISMGVDESSSHEQGAGDQGLMFGFACDETPELMPLPISLSHQIMRELSRVRKTGAAPFLGPDAKSQVSVEYKGGTPVGVRTVVVSTQHAESKSLKELEAFVINDVVKKIVPARFIGGDTRFLINPTGRFVVGGPLADAGLTGRKIIVDSYGGYSRHGGGAFSGKDPTKVDRSAAYMMRWIAKNVVAAGVAKRCELQVAYAIGVAQPVSVYIETFGTGKVDDEKIAEAIRAVFDLRPKAISAVLELRRPIYRETAAYGHFGREPTKDGHFSWERTNKAEELRSAVGR